MADVSGSRGRTLEPQSGGKMVRARRSAGSRTPYERPKLEDSDTGNPNWISKLLLSPTRAIATGAGKLISTVFSQDDLDSDSDSNSDSSSESDSGSEGNAENDYDEDDSLSQRANLSKESNKSEKVNYFRKDPEPKAGKRDKLRAIEELILQETFSREEYNRLLKIIESRVVVGKEVDSQRLTKTPKEKSEEEEEKNLRCTAVMEARRWLSEKKPKSAPKSDSKKVDEDEVGSPADMAKLYMRARPLWASPSPMGALLFDEATPSSVGSLSLPSTKVRRDTPASGSWSIKEELQRVRAKASEEMLSTLPSKKIDWSSFALEKRAVTYPLIAERMHSSANEKDKSELLNASLHTVTGISNSKGLEPTPLESQNEASLPNEVNINLENNQDSQAAHIHEGAGPTNGLEEMLCEEPSLPLGNSFHTEAAPEQEATQNNEDRNLARSSSNNNISDTFGDGAGELLAQTPMEDIPRSSQPVAVYKIPAPEQEAKLDVDGEDHNSVSSSSNKNISDAFREETCELLTESSIDDIPRTESSMGDISRSSQAPPRYSTRNVSKRGQARDGPGKKPSRYSRT